MIQANEVNAEATKAVRSRAPRKSGDQAPRGMTARVPKSKDAGKAKVSFYLDAATSAKLAVAAIIRGVDQSDVANEILGRALSSVTFYDKPTRPADQGLTVTEIGSEAAA